MKGLIGLVTFAALIWIFWITYMWLRPKVWKNKNKNRS